jgi:hypothetical protein
VGSKKIHCFNSQYHKFLATFFHGSSYVRINFGTKTGWAILWAIFSQAHLVTLTPTHLQTLASFRPGSLAVVQHLFQALPLPPQVPFSAGVIFKNQFPP